MKTSEAVKLVPKYRNLKFKKKSDFIKWLNETSHIRIELHDFGQDLQTIWVASNGEIIHANLQTKIWCGRFIKLDRIQTGNPIIMFDTDSGKWVDMPRLTIEETVI